jgi:hypothetical protein
VIAEGALSAHGVSLLWCISGDWASVGQLLASQGMGGYYDVILTAETIYNEESQQRLLDCIKQVRLAD